MLCTKFHVKIVMLLTSVKQRDLSKCRQMSKKEQHRVIMQKKFKQRVKRLQYKFYMICNMRFLPELLWIFFFLFFMEQKECHIFNYLVYLQIIVFGYQEITFWVSWHIYIFYNGKLAEKEQKLYFNLLLFVKNTHENSKLL